METPVEYNAGKKEELVCIAKMIDHGEDKDLKHFKIYTRQEAIEKITDALCVLDYNLDSGYAEAALDSLLGDSK